MIKRQLNRRDAECAKRKSMKSCSWISLCVLCVFAVPLYSAPPRDELLRLVPNDVGFVVVVQDLREHWKRAQDSPFTKKFLQTAPGKALIGEIAAKQFAEIDRELTKELGVP